MLELLSCQTFCQIFFYNGGHTASFWIQPRPTTHFWRENFGIFFFKIFIALMAPTFVFLPELLIAKVQYITLWTVKLDMDPRGLSLAQMANFWAHGHVTGGYFWNWSQIILLQIDGFLQRLDLKYHPSSVFSNPHILILRKKIDY